MDEQEILDGFKHLSIWKKGERRAPHKPLLLLLAIGYLQNNDQRLLSFKEIEPKLIELLTEFGTPRNNKNTHYPYWRLKGDGIWEVERDDLLAVNSSGDVRKTELRKKEIRAGFKPEVYQLLKARPEITYEICSELLASHFPDTIHEDIVLETGINIDGYLNQRIPRDPNFRKEVLRAYQYRCAVCDFDVRIGAKTVCLEAAHIKWHSHGGPDDVRNGLALCTLHHKLFDLGAFTLGENREFIVSEKVVGTDGLDLWLTRFHGDRITEPINAAYEPKVQYITWNHKEVFKDPGRQ